MSKRQVAYIKQLKESVYSETVPVLGILRKIRIKRPGSQGVGPPVLIRRVENALSQKDDLGGTGELGCGYPYEIQAVCKPSAGIVSPVP